MGRNDPPNWAETTHPKIRPKQSRPKRPTAETTDVRNDSRPKRPETFYPDPQNPWGAPIIWRISICAFSLSKKEYIWHHRLKIALFHFAPCTILPRSLLTDFPVIHKFKKELLFACYTCFNISSTFFKIP